MLRPMKKYCYLLLLLATSFSCSKDVKDASADTGKGGSLARFAIAGNYLYVVNDQVLKVFDISNAADPVYRGENTIGWEIETITSFGDKLFIGSSTALFIFDITDPVKPVMETRVQHFRSCDPVVTDGKTAYLTLRGGGRCGGPGNALMVYDVQILYSPVLKKQIPLNGPYGLGLQDSALYVCDGINGLAVFNIKEPNQPKLLKTINDGSAYYDVVPYRGVLIAYVQNGVRFFDISKPQDPVFLSALLN